jgi:aryl-alcohol dehydrogenase-like predicted oxidoreductase
VRTPLFPTRVGLGCWRLAAPGRPSRADAVATILAAYDAGARVFDTADSYGLDDDDRGYAELLLRESLAGVDDVTIVTKGGFVRPGGRWEHRGDPAWLARAIEESAERLGVERIDCYLLHGVDPRHDLLESLEPLIAAKEAGRIGAIGLSNVSAAQLARASALTAISVVQNRLSVTVRPAGWEEAVRACDAGGTWFMPHTPFGPTPEEGGIDRRVADEPAVQRIAEAQGVSPAVVALAWLLGLSDRCVVVPGARRAASIRDSLTALPTLLTNEQSAELSALPAGPVA